MFEKEKSDWTGVLPVTLKKYLPAMTLRPAHEHYSFMELSSESTQFMID